MRPLLTYRVSRPTNLPRIDSNHSFKSTDLRDLRRTQTKTFRRILQSTINSRSKNPDIRKPVGLTVDSLIMLMGINQR